MSAPTCPSCGRENDATSSFCRGCGKPLRAAELAPVIPSAGGQDRRCPACMAPIELGHRFCGHCGRPLPSHARPDPILTPPPMLARVPRPSSGAPAPRVTAPAAPLVIEPPVPEAAPARPGPPGPPGVRRPTRLVPLRHDGLPGTVLPLGSEFVVCGRSRGQLRFEDDPAIGPEHARFEFRGDVLYIEDLGSVNGTFLRLRSPRPLLAGDEIRIGRQLLRVEPMPRLPEGAGPRPWGSPDAGYRVRLVQQLDGGGTGEIFPLSPGENSIGREMARVCFPADRFVSARHARIDVAATGIVLSDTSSSNGTFIRVALPEPLAPGDQVLIGHQLLRIE